MKKKIIITGFLSLTAFSATPVLATESIAYSLFGDPAYLTSCNQCHTNGDMNTADKGNLMSAAKNAYNQDKWGLSGLKAFVAIPAAPIVPTCTNGQILNPAKTACETPAPIVPTCSNGQVLNPAKTACVTPAPIVPTCKSTEVLTANICVAKPVVVIIPPTVIPKCKITEILNAAKTACVLKPVTVTPPTCATGEFLNLTKTACVKPPVTAVNTKPVLNAVAQQWDAKVGELISIPLSVKDAEQDVFAMSGSVAGSKFSVVHPDAAGLPSIDFLWTPTAAQVNKIFTISFMAKETKTALKLASNKVSVKIRVWAAGDRSAASITKLNVITSAWSGGKLTLAGNVVFNKLLTAAEKQAFIAQKLDLTVTSGINPIGGALVGAATVTLDKNGNWSISFPVTQAQVPCDVTLQYDGQNASRTVSGAPATCLKTAATTSRTIPLQFAKNDDDHESGEHDNEHSEHDD